MTPKTRSLHRQLTLALVAVLGLSLCAFSIVLHEAFRRGLLRQFDARLGEDAQAIADMVEERAQGPWQFERGSLEDFEPRRAAAYFEVWMDDGSILARSPSLGSAELDPRSVTRAGAAQRVTLPDGRQGRGLVVALPPRTDEEGPSQPSGRLLTIAVARQTLEVDVTLARFRVLLLASALSALLVASLAGFLAIRRGLLPLEQVSSRVDRIDAGALGERLPTENLPRELRPTVEKINELLARIETSFERERSFSAAISHELRTPLAGLRSLLEVTSRRERSTADYRHALDEALGIVRQMTALSENLLLLTRVEAQQIEVRPQEIALRDLVADCLEPHEARAELRSLQLQNLVPASARATTDREKLRIVVSNLLSNAVEYTSSGGTVRIQSDAAQGSLLEVWDSGPPIPDEALERVFDRFFRLDASRSNTDSHFGIGLALARGLCTSLTLGLVAVNLPDGSIAFRITCPTAAADAVT
jgi:signal transduction histidine kinase